MRRRSRSGYVREQRNQCRLDGAKAFLAACVLALLCPAEAACGQDLDLRPTSSRSARRDAVDAIPLEKLDEVDRRELSSIVENASLYRRLPTEVVTCDPRLFSLFMQHPQAMVNLWEVLAISNVRMKPSGENTFEATDGNGTQGTIRIVESVCDERAQNRVVVLANGLYNGNKFTGPVRAECVVLVRSGSVRDSQGKAFVTARVDVFIHLDQVGVDLIARTLHPILVRVADRNFEQTMEFVSSFSDAAAKNPRGIERLAARLDHVSQDVQDRLTAIAYDLARTGAGELSQSSRPAKGTSRVARAQDDE